MSIDRWRPDVESSSDPVGPERAAGPSRAEAKAQLLDRRAASAADPGRDTESDQVDSPEKSGAEQPRTRQSAGDNGPARPSGEQAETRPPDSRAGGTETSQDNQPSRVTDRRPPAGTSPGPSALERKLDLLDRAAGRAEGETQAAEARAKDGSAEPERLGWRLSRIWRDSRPTIDGRAFYEKSDERMWKFATSAEPAPGRYTADLHGNPTAFRVGSHDLDARQLAALIRKDEKWNGRPIRLMSCETGKGDDPIAQELADQLGVTVAAPTELVSSDEHGRVWTTSRRRNEFGMMVDTVPHDGVWIEFDPRTKGGDHAPNSG
ncbi:hypothetical protein [Frankia sp. ACN1ag]|uniref:hypothetical protein n=1 Tax=Frankia sp. ACN1ag TaxID=102891 RepID=UPI0006DCCF76|nr:hypothetical protein [Frankia sp. ACN1ag]KQC39233.1 hypothetical protein UK82_06195 [Frankia sp. ACN1ag]